MAADPAPGAAAPGALLLLADGRFPAGGHAHSGGAEAACRSGRVHDADTMAAFLAARLRTVGLVGAALAAAAAGRQVVDWLAELDEAADARTPSGAQRAVSRRLGRQLLRAGRAAWPGPVLDALAERWPGGAHQAVVLGVVGAVAGLDPAAVAGVAAYESVNGPATACVRLLGLDPYQVAARLARLAPEVDAVAGRAAEAAGAALREGAELLPAASAPLLDIYAEQHSSWKVRLFAS
ncbi:urease accessory protein UreF [Kitasatospora sp. MMS16-BH015]|uniref:urease accessory protein UreF n=1 Tax=Kitasatospora sp. MMS16-BH015 TaxID=2018025 RepID=UPI000CA3E82D|nr:urease accessory UreF family protein [Kitasatospora sp. MMS16-BH015]AUG81482.1 urease accessory protein UreF [Kitasatospora sp. MMS16-BH015]